MPLFDPARQPWIMTFVVQVRPDFVQHRVNVPMLGDVRFQVMEVGAVEPLDECCLCEEGAAGSRVRVFHRRNAY
ncbi:hypothetical protein GZ77_01460 [Endozoicomonas montiporae]|uniref:Uncharacterized protein n=2 Tax=Endozoicomonas montiporae TaxID=1027273 RepID=A0A081NA75_9GAMM|nr:hypothetical protein [Endozoicomonas montiporae]KEQ15348.1 hypothetical protein GZ77_01460 [Endozoicomonas montiporae]